MKQKQASDDEGSLKSVLAVAAAFTALSFICGVNYAFGVFQEEFVVVFNETNFAVAWIGTLQATCLILFGPLAGYLADIYGCRAMCLVSCVMVSGSLFISSYATELWQLYLSLGILNGSGGAFGYYPGIACVGHWWVRRRGAANGIAVAGAGLGGLAWGPLAQTLLDQYGWQSTLRIIGTACAVCLLGSAFLMFPNPNLKFDRPTVHEGPKPSFLKEIFCNRFFVFLLTGGFFEAFGYYVPFFFINSYAIDKGVSDQFAALVLGVMNGASGVGRIVLGSVGDAYGYVHCFIYCMGVSAISLYFWLLCSSGWSMMLFAAFFGFHVGGYISLQAPMLATIFGVERLGAVVGILYSAGVPGNLLGGAIAGYITDVNSPNYTPTVLFSASMYTIYVLLLFPVWMEHRKFVARLGTEKETLLEQDAIMDARFPKSSSFDIRPGDALISNNLLFASPSEQKQNGIDLIPSQDFK